jgi:error-prone DNA polymerase
VLGTEAPLPLLDVPRFNEGDPMLPVPSEGQNLVADFQSLGLTLGRHPVALLRTHLASLHLATAADIRHCRHGERVRAAGIVINRQRPSTASGVIFMTLEDETGHINVVVWPWVVERQRREVVGSRMVGIHGTIEREGEVVHLVAGRITDLSHLLGRLHTRSRDFS